MKPNIRDFEDFHGNRNPGMDEIKMKGINHIWLLD